MGDLHIGPRDPLSGEDRDSFFVLHVVPPGCQPKGEGDCGYLIQYNQAYSG